MRADDLPIPAMGPDLDEPTTRPGREHRRADPAVHGQQPTAPVTEDEALGDDGVVRPTLVGERACAPSGVVKRESP